MMYLQIRIPNRRRYLDMVSFIGDCWFSRSNAWTTLDSFALAIQAYQEVMSPIVIGGASDHPTR